MRILFDKSFMQPDDIVELLRHRGLEIENPQRVSLYIRNIGYYRLSAYMYPFLCQPKDEHLFKLGSKFQDSLNLYRFDKKLRLFLFNLSFGAVCTINSIKVVKYQQINAK